MISLVINILFNLFFVFLNNLKDIFCDQRSWSSSFVDIVSQLFNSFIEGIRGLFMKGADCNPSCKSREIWMHNGHISTCLCQKVINLLSILTFINSIFNLFKNFFMSNIFFIKLIRESLKSFL
ncbi:unnamed protein product [Moneuplotes crassus]|uniref:Uncharacterized protein n=1 Tax=Euplotes crassus TaxID=5936 RepID=A0AAD1Y617_EUPCR|nr:unnamed protein product [Moneuplotes crassus]